MKICLYKRKKGFNIGNLSHGGNWYEFDIGFYWIRIEK